MAQAVHAGTQFVLEHPEHAKDWEEKWKNLVCLAVPSQDDILLLLDRLTGWCGNSDYHIKAPFSYFVEPDLNNEHTSVACLLTEGQAKEFKRLSLSLRSSSRGGEV